MPVYQFQCHVCGPVEMMLPMASRHQPGECPGCEGELSRQILSAPRLGAGHRAHIRAEATNERAQHEPKSTRQGGKHPPGCGCCGSGKGKRGSGQVVKGPAGEKMFPAKRPWMISH